MTKPKKPPRGKTFHASKKALLIAIAIDVVSLVCLFFTAAFKFSGNPRLVETGTATLVVGGLLGPLGAVCTALFGIRLWTRYRLVIGEDSIAYVSQQKVVMNLPYRNICATGFVEEAAAAGVDLFDYEDDDTFPIRGEMTRRHNKSEYGFEFMVAFGPFTGNPRDIYRVFMRKLEAWRRENGVDYLR